MTLYAGNIPGEEARRKKEEGARERKGVRTGR